MSRKNNFRLLVTRNRRFVANAAVDIGITDTHCSVNVTDDAPERAIASTVLLMVVYNIIEDDGDRLVIEALLKERGATAISPINSKLVTPEQALIDTEDDIPF